MSLHLVRIIAAYEMRILLRSWFFRIFAGGVIVGLGIFNIALNVPASGAPWIYKALSSSIPYANLIILNLGQAIVAVFLSSEFLKQDRKNDTVEVIYARSMTNTQYITGKTLGILAVFLVLNIIILLMGIGFSFLSNVTNQNILAYFTYPLLISLPTLIFILGLSFFIMVTVKNQAVTFILLIGYIALTVFYLNKKAYHLFDYIAYQVPMIYSSISGFANLNGVLIHRSIYLLLGLGFISLTIYRLNRLPQSKGFTRMPLIMGILLLVSGSFMIWKYLDMKKSVLQFRQKVVDLNNRYAYQPKPMVDSCRLELEHKGNQISVIAKLLVHYEGDRPLDTLIFSLNPSLSIQSVMINNNPATFEQELQIVRIMLSESMDPGDALEIQIQYAGTIDENVAFLDQTDRIFESNPTYEVFRLHKRFAFLQKEYVCLTSEALWYPVSGAGYAKAMPMQYAPDFVKYSLRVKTSAGLTPISQGKATIEEDGSFDFNPEYPLPKISLLIGNYVKYSTLVDSIEYSLYAIKGHDYFGPYFKDAIDTIPHLIRDLKKEYEVNLGLDYPFKRMILAEVPVHFALDNHIYAYASDAVQPEMFLCPEKGVLHNSSDFRSRKYRLEKEMKNNNTEVLPVVIQSDMFREFVRANFMAKRGQSFNYEHIIKWNTYSLFPQYLTFYTQLKSTEWPVLGIALESYISERNNKAGTSLQWYEDLSSAEKINLELRDAPLAELLQVEFEPEDNERNPVTLSDLVQVKGLSLFNILNSRLEPGELDTVLNQLLSNYAHKPIPYEILSYHFKIQFNIDLSAEVNKWYMQKSLPGFLIRNLQSYKVMDGEVSKYQIRFQISNPEDADGIITLNVEFNDPNRQNNENSGDFHVDFSRKINIPARSSREIGYVFSSQPARMSLVTHISRNLPNNLIFGFSGFTETKNIALLDHVANITFFDKTNSENEIIADNEDSIFRVEQAASQAYLKSLVKKNKSERYKYSSIWWNAPKEWKAVLRSEFYGNYVHSSHYTRGGTGERTAWWQANLPEAGSYDVYYYINKVNVGWNRNNKSTDYNLSVYHESGVDKIIQSTENVDIGWNYLGTWQFASDTARVELSNKSSGDKVFADAVKWVLNK